MRCLILLAVVTAALADGASRCTGVDVESLEDTLRQSACALNGTEKQAFAAYVKAKHGVYSLVTGVIINSIIIHCLHVDDPQMYFGFARLFELSVAKVWCRTSCANPARENITWCVNIAYRDRDVETCIRSGNDHQMIITNSTCEAELINLPRFFNLPTVSICSTVNVSSIIYIYIGLFILWRFWLPWTH